MPVLLHHVGPSAATAAAGPRARSNGGGGRPAAAAAVVARAAAPSPPPPAASSSSSSRRPPSRSAALLLPPPAAAPKQTPPSSAAPPPAGASNPRGQMLVYVPPHPLIRHWLAVARNASSPPPLFRGALAELGRCLLYELSRDGGFLPTLSGAVDTAGGDESEVEFVDPTKPVVLVPVTRAGLPLLEHSATVFPASTTHHVAFSRRASSSSSAAFSSSSSSSAAAPDGGSGPELILDTLPKTLTEDDRVVIADACLASGATVMRAVREVVARGCSPWNVRVVCALAAPPALKQLADAFPGLCVYAACIDAEVDAGTGLLRPGFGEAGARAFGAR